MDNAYNILICPLEWGLGHAARMIIMALKLKEKGHNIIIGTGREHQALFRDELPGLKYIDFSGFKPSYSRHLPQYIFLLLKIPSLLYHIVKEHIRLREIINEYSIDIVISDNRFGLWNKRVKSVYITHMPLIPLPGILRFLEYAGLLLHRAVIRRYSLCLIPDLPGELNITGRLSHGIRIPYNTRYTGILSRFSDYGKNSFPEHPEFEYNCVILSGPEPQRGILKKKLTAALMEKKPVTVIFEGKPGLPGKTKRTGNIILYNYLPAGEMQKIIAGSRQVIARSGYSTVMDLICLHCSALLIPTPGQPEQEYLAHLLSEKGWFSCIPQKKINPDLCVPENRNIVPEEVIRQSRILLQKAIDEILKEPETQD